MSNEASYMKLDPEFKKKWMEALRSGEYKQGKYKLLDQTVVVDIGKSEPTDQYCCLGVACVVAGVPKGAIMGVDIIKRGSFTVEQNKLLEPIAGETNENDVVWKLVDMNDGSSSFAAIANWIEANL